MQISVCWHQAIPAAPAIHLCCQPQTSHRGSHWPIWRTVMWTCVNHKNKEMNMILTTQKIIWMLIHTRVVAPSLFWSRPRGYREKKTLNRTYIDKYIKIWSPLFRTIFNLRCINALIMKTCQFMSESLKKEIRFYRNSGKIGQILFCFWM